jgi:hypothetical protein
MAIWRAQKRAGVRVRALLLAGTVAAVAAGTGLAGTAAMAAPAANAAPAATGFAR